MKTSAFATSLASVLFMVLSAGAIRASAETASTSLDSHTQAVARLKPAHDSHVAGTIQFIPVQGGVRVIADVSGLSPGPHGFHIHEKADLTAPDLSSAGGHFNPTKEMHGDLHAAHHHLGDFGNLVADDKGHATADFVDAQIALEGTNSIVGHSVIIHGGADDLKSQPAGNSGPRIAGGEIQIVSSR